MQYYHDYASFCPVKYDVYSVLSTEGGISIGHIVYINKFIEINVDSCVTIHKMGS